MPLKRSWWYRRSLLVLAMFLAAAPVGADEVVARMGKHEVKASELERLLAQQGVQLAGDDQDLQAGLSRLARLEAVRKALLAEAMAKGWDKKPEVVARIQRAREQVLISAYVGSLVQPPADFPSDAAVKVVYDNNQKLFAAPVRYRVAQIFVPAEDSGGARKAADLARQARAPGADFAALARQHSRHVASSGRGGDMGWLTEQVMVPAVRPVLTGLTTGQVSDPVKTDQGWHIFKLLDLRPAGTRPLEEVRGVIVSNLRLRKLQEGERAYIDEMIRKTPITVNEAALAGIRSPEN